MNYFEAVGSRRTLVKDAQPIERNPALLAEYLKKQKGAIETDLLAVDRMFKNWCDTLFSGFNIAVQGPQSKYRLLETFKSRYLDSNRIPDFDCSSADNGTSVLNIATLKFHGFCPISLERVCHYLFNITDERKMNDEDMKRFVTKTKSTKTHYVFLIHSFELFYRDSRKVCDLIFQLYKEEPNYIHLLVSSDHINSNKILNHLKIQLQLVFYLSPYEESFFHERTNAAGIINEDFDAATQTRLFNEELDLQSVKDVYQALQDNGQKILLYILTNSLESKEPMKFEKLLEYCLNEFIVRRNIQLKNHLGELTDHRIIEIDERENIICLVSRSNTKKFLELYQAEAD